MAALMDFKGVERTFRRSRQTFLALAGFDMEISPGEAVGLIGESGAGKSTLAWLALGLDRPTAGTIRYEGKDIWSLGRRDSAAFRRSVQAVFQNPSNSLNPRMRIGDIVAEPLLVHGVKPEGGVRAEVGRLLELVRLPGSAMNRRPYELSGGQQQRAAIARALALRPRLIVMDEPVSALDMSTRGSVLRLARSLKKELNVAYLYISHDLDTVAALCDKVVILRQGRIEETTTVQTPDFVPASAYGRELFESLRLQPLSKVVA